jgi:molybdopterin-guanine dinucleotide biosynthesis protein A
MKHKITGVILSGGKSVRMGGQNKAFLKIEGVPIVKRIQILFEKIFEEIIIVTDQEEMFSSFNARIYRDLIPGRGALGGLYTGLSYSSFPFSFCVACDMPFLKESVIEYLIQSMDAYDAFVPRSKDGLEPLHALYSKNCLEAIKKTMEQENYKIIDFYPLVRVKVIEESDFFSLDPMGESFINVNTPEELMRTQERRSCP